MSYVMFIQIIWDFLVRGAVLEIMIMKGLA